MQLAADRRAVADRDAAAKQALKKHTQIVDDKQAKEMKRLSNIAELETRVYSCEAELLDAASSLKAEYAAHTKTKRLQEANRHQAYEQALQKAQKHAAGLPPMLGEDAVTCINRGSEVPVWQTVGDTISSMVKDPNNSTKVKETIGNAGHSDFLTKYFPTMADDLCDRLVSAVKVLQLEVPTKLHQKAEALGTNQLLKQDFQNVEVPDNAEYAAYLRPANGEVEPVGSQRQKERAFALVIHSTYVGRVMTKRLKKIFGKNGQFNFDKYNELLDARSQHGGHFRYRREMTAMEERRIDDQLKTIFSIDNGGIKGLIRILFKLANDYDGDLGRVVDTIRYAWTVPDAVDLEDAVDVLLSEPDFTGLRQKSTMTDPLADVKMSIFNVLFKPMRPGPLGEEEITFGNMVTNPAFGEIVELTRQANNVNRQTSDAAVRLLEQRHIADDSIQLIVELQLYTHFFRQMRDLGHLWYKIVRSETAEQLFKDFAAFATWQGKLKVPPELKESVPMAHHSAPAVPSGSGGTLVVVEHRLLGAEPVPIPTDAGPVLRAALARFQSAAKAVAAVLREHTEQRRRCARAQLSAQKAARKLEASKSAAARASRAVKKQLATESSATARAKSAELARRLAEANAQMQRDEATAAIAKEQAAQEMAAQVRRELEAIRAKEAASLALAVQLAASEAAELDAAAAHRQAADDRARAIAAERALAQRELDREHQERKSVVDRIRATANRQHAEADRARALRQGKLRANQLQAEEVRIAASSRIICAEPTCEYGDSGYFADRANDGKIDPDNHQWYCNACWKDYLAEFSVDDSKWINTESTLFGATRKEIDVSVLRARGLQMMGLPNISRHAEEDNGKFIVIAPPEFAVNEFAMVLIFEHRCTNHFIQVDTTFGENSLINGKRYMPFTSINEMVAKLSSELDFQKVGWPIKLRFGLDALTGEMVSSAPIKGRAG